MIWEILADVDWLLVFLVALNAVALWAIAAAVIKIAKI